MKKGNVWIWNEQAIKKFEGHIMVKILLCCLFSFISFVRNFGNLWGPKFFDFAIFGIGILPFLSNK